MADPVTLRNFRDSYVSSDRPNRNFNSMSRLKVQDTHFYTYVYFANPAPPGAVISSAKLRVWNSEAFTGGAVTLDVRLLAGKWGGSTLTFNNKPAVGGATYSSSSVTGAAANTMWEIDFTPALALVQNGTAWYGLRIATSSGTLRNFYSSQAENAAYRPQVVIQWSDEPEPPDGLAPNGNRATGSAKPTLTYDFTDVAGDTTLAMHQVQLSTDIAFGSTTFDSGWVATTDPYFDLSASTYAGLGDGNSIYWRVRVQDGAGVQSDWSDPAQFKYISRGVLTSSTLGGPNGSGKMYVADNTPPILWSLTGRTQAAYRVMIYDVSDPDTMLFDTGKVSGTTNSIDTGPKKVLKGSSATYHLTIRVWDTISREKTPDTPLYYSYEQDFVYDPVSAGSNPTAPVGVGITPAYPYPWIDVQFTRSTPPDSFTIWRDGEVIDTNLDPGPLSTGGTGYTYRDRSAAPRVTHTWEITANVNAKDSAKSNGINGKSRPSVTWLMNPDTSSPICLVKSADEPTPVVDAQGQSSQTVHQPVGRGASPVLITQNISGFEGHVDAVLADGIVDGLSARTMRDRFKAWKKNPGRKLVIYMVDEALTIVPYNMTYRPRAKSGGVIFYDVSFDFFEVDF